MNINIDPANPNSIYVQLSKELKRYIVEKKLKPGDMLPDIKSIAKDANVSIKTAERALDKLIEEGICFRRSKKGTFVADKRMSLVKKGKEGASPFIAFILIGTDFGNPYHARVLHGAEETASSKGFYLLCSSLPYGNNTLIAKKIDALTSNKDFHAVMIGGKVDKTAIQAIISVTKNKIPLVVMGRGIDGFFETITHIVDSNELAIRTALSFLKEYGHKRIAFLNEPLKFAWNKLIRDEFYNFMKINNFPFIKEIINDNLPDDTPETAYREILKMIPQFKKFCPTAITCATDKQAWAAIKALRENGFDVPDDISVIGCGNLHFGEYIDPPLTSVDQCQEEKGREGVKAAIGEYPPGTILKIPVKLVERESVRKILTGTNP